MGIEVISLSANLVRDLSLNGANMGFNASCKPSHEKVENSLTGFTFLYYALSF